MTGRWTSVVAVLLSIIYVASGLECYTCTNYQCDDRALWRSEECAWGNQLCYQFQDFAGKVSKRGCVNDRCSNAVGYHQGVSCFVCSTNNCNGDRLTHGKDGGATGGAGSVESSDSVGGGSQGGGSAGYWNDPYNNWNRGGTGGGGSSGGGGQGGGGTSGGGSNWNGGGTSGGGSGGWNGGTSGGGSRGGQSGGGGGTGGGGNRWVGGAGGSSTQDRKYWEGDPFSHTGGDSNRRGDSSWQYTNDNRNNNDPNRHTSGCGSAGCYNSAAHLKHHFVSIMLSITAVLAVVYKIV